MGSGERGDSVEAFKDRRTRHAADLCLAGRGEKRAAGFDQPNTFHMSARKSISTRCMPYCESGSIRKVGEGGEGVRGG